MNSGILKNYTNKKGIITGSLFAAAFAFLISVRRHYYYLKNKTSKKIKAENDKKSDTLSLSKTESIIDENSMQKLIPLINIEKIVEKIKTSLIHTAVIVVDSYHKSEKTKTIEAISKTTNEANLDDIEIEGVQVENEPKETIAPGNEDLKLLVENLKQSKEEYFLESFEKKLYEDQKILYTNPKGQLTYDNSKYKVSLLFHRLYGFFGNG